MNIYDDDDDISNHIQVNSNSNDPPVANVPITNNTARGPQPALMSGDPSLFANLNHLPNAPGVRKYYVGPANGSKGFRKWSDVHPEHYNHNIAEPYSNAYNTIHLAHVIWNDNEINYNRVIPTVGLKYFNKFFPPSVLNSIVKAVKERLRMRNCPRLSRDFNVIMLKKFLGITLVKVLERPRGTVEDLFAEDDEIGVMRNGNYERRFNMRLNDYKNIVDNFRIRPLEGRQGNQDMWYEVRELIHEFNSNMEKSFYPGKFLTVDEIMSAWKGLSCQFTAMGIPHLTKIIRKPEGVGAEMKAVACGESGIILKVDLMEGASLMNDKPYQREYGAGCAVILRLIWHWKDSHRVVIADSAFSSFKTLYVLWCLCKTFFMGIVKTAHTHYPVDIFKEWFDAEDAIRQNDHSIQRGTWHVLSSTFRNRLPNRNERAQDVDFPVMAICWADKKAKHIISNWGTTLRSPTNSLRKRSKTVRDPVTGILDTVHCDKEVMQPEVIEDFYKRFAVIDVNDHLRQGILGIERQWYTKHWWMRIFQTILGVVVTSCYLAHKLENPSEHMEFIPFVNLLCSELIFPTTGRVMRQRGNPNSTDVQPPEVNNHILYIFIKILFFYKIRNYLLICILYSTQLMK